MKLWAIIWALSICLNQFAECKRSGSFGRGSRGSSRAGRGFTGLGRSAHNYGGSSTGGGRGKWTDRILGRNRGGGGTGHGIMGNRGTGGGIFGGRSSRPNYGAGRAAKTGLLGGGLLGGSRGLLGGRSRGMGGGGFRNSGIGSHSRAGTFKNMLVGAAAGFLAYKAGKAIIKNVARPMMWNNRPYYWGSQYYPSHHQQQGYGPGAQSKTMCRMPIDPNDPQLGQVYMEDNSRPKEIVWACEYHEECCGYECCPRQSASSIY